MEDIVHKRMQTTTSWWWQKWFMQLGEFQSLVYFALISCKLLQGQRLALLRVLFAHKVTRSVLTLDNTSCSMYKTLKTCHHEQLSLSLKRTVTAVEKLGDIINCCDIDEHSGLSSLDFIWRGIQDLLLCRLLESVSTLLFFKSLAFTSMAKHRPLWRSVWNQCGAIVDDKREQGTIR